MDDIREKIGALTAKCDAAHNRVDKLETGIKADLVSIQADLKELNGHMHRGKGWGAAMLALSGFLGAALAQIIPLIFNR